MDTNDNFTVAPTRNMTCDVVPQQQTERAGVLVKVLASVLLYDPKEHSAVRDRTERAGFEPLLSC